MILKCLGSSSAGNCYLLDSGKEVLVLDCGIDIAKIKKGLNWDISRIVGVCVTHSHLDHAKSVKDFEDMGIPVFKRYTHTDITDRVNFGGFKVISFHLPHNGTPNYGFYIKADGQKILYLTDFEYCQFNFKALEVNHILIECNYQQELVNRDLPNFEHKVRGHCSLDTCKKFIQANKTNALRTVVLCHMGAETTISGECVAEVQKVANCPVYVAEKGKEILLRESNCPF